jgi:hypothetical protein
MLATTAGWEWGPNGMTGAMVAGMALLACAPPLPRLGRAPIVDSARSCQG